MELIFNDNTLHAWEGAQDFKTTTKMLSIYANAGQMTNFHGNVRTFSELPSDKSAMAFTEINQQK